MTKKINIPKTRENLPDVFRVNFFNASEKSQIIEIAQLFKLYLVKDNIDPIVGVAKISFEEGEIYLYDYSTFEILYKNIDELQKMFVYDSVEDEVELDKLLAEYESAPDTVKKWLNQIDPERFKLDLSVQLSYENAWSVFNDASEKSGLGEAVINVRGAGRYKCKSLWLSKDYNWELKIDDEGENVLIPTKKI